MSNQKQTYNKQQGDELSVGALRNCRSVTYGKDGRCKSCGDLWREHNGIKWVRA